MKGQTLFAGLQQDCGKSDVRHSHPSDRNNLLLAVAA